MAGETLSIDTTDLSSTARITSWEGILMAPPFRGDLIELANTSGATWEAGPQAAYTFEVPLVMNSQDVGTAVGQMRAIQAFADGATHTIKRQFTSTTATVIEACTGLITSATPMWDLRFRNRVGLLLTVQVLSVWATTT